MLDNSRPDFPLPPRLAAAAALAGGLFVATACVGDITPAGDNPEATGSGATKGSGGNNGTGGGSGGGQSNSGTGGGSGGDTSTSSSTGAGGTVDRTSVSFECDPDDTPSVTQLRRLSRLQYENSLRALFDSVSLGAVVDTAQSALTQLPPDGENESVYTGNDARVSQRHVDAFLGVADSLASEVSGDPQSLAQLAGDCANDEPLAETCLQDFVTEFGRRVFRRPLSEQEAQRYMEWLDPAESNAVVFRGVLMQMLLSPQFLYHVEVEGTAVDDDEGVLELSSYELASRLSFHFWQSMPDDELFAAAEDGSLLEEAGFQAQVDRLFEDARTQQVLNQFWHQWYQLEGFAGFASTPAFAAFLEGETADDGLVDDMMDEVNALLSHYTFDTAGTYRDLLSSDLVLTQSDQLASLYGVEAWDGSSDPQSFGSSERSGILTRAALLVEGNELTNPIKRGAFVLKSILCEDLHPPSDLPAEALALPELDSDLSTRERFEVKTSPPECANCHRSFNPFGFVLESYDALGRFRTEEKIYNDAGDLENTVPIDPEVDVLIDGTTQTVMNPVEFSAMLAESSVVDDCFARQYFRFTYRRDESTGDSCALASIRDNVAPGGSLKQALRDVAMTPEFRRRVVGAL